MQFFCNMRVTVTGGAGYVGSVLVPRLLAEGHEVRVFDKLLFGDGSLREVAKNIELVKGDIRRFPDDLLRGQDAVIHLAALSNDPTAEYNPKANHEINTVGAVNVARACAKMGVPRFIMASSCSIYYSPTPTEEFMSEDSRVSPTAPYSKSKKEAEDAIIKLKSKEFHPCFLRKGTIYGWSPRMRYDLVVNAMTRTAYENGVINVNSGGEMYRPLLDINDAADAYLACLNASEGDVSGEVFNVLHKNYIVLALAHWMKYVLRGKKNIDVNVSYDNANTRSYRVDASKIEAKLGFKAGRGISQAVNDMWGRINGGESSDFQNPKYYNIRWLELLVEEARLKGTGDVL